MCEEICPVDAIKVRSHEITVNHDECTHCGACVTVCPTQALSSIWFADDELQQSALKSLEATHGHPIIVCVEALAALDENQDYDHVKAIEMQCLERVDESLLMLLAVAGAQDITLVTGDCQNCPTGCMGAVWSLTSEYAIEMLQALEHPVPIRHTEELPQTLFQIERAKFQNNEISRSDILSNLKHSALDVGNLVLDEVLEDQRWSGVASILGFSKGRSVLMGATRGQICQWAMVALALQAPDSAHKDAAEVLANLQDRQFNSRIFATINIDGTKCVNCFMCAAYCLANAVGKYKPEKRVLGHMAKPYLCNQCGMCCDICRKQAITIDAKVNVGTMLQEQDILFTFEEWDQQKKELGLR